MAQEKRWLQFYWGGKAYAVPMEDIGGIVRRDRFEQADALTSIPIQYLHEEYVEGNEKWVIILRNHSTQLRLLADRIIGEVRTGKNINQENDTMVGLFSIWKLDSQLTGGNAETAGKSPVFSEISKNTGL